MRRGVLHQLVRETPIAFLDVETTGLNAGADRVIEIAVLRKEPGREAVLVLNTLVNPQRPVAATEIHGITDNDVKDAPHFQDIAGEVVKALSHCVVAAYNVYFDMRFLIDELGRVGLRQDIPHVCLMYLRPMLGLGPRASLNDACAAHGIQHHGLHIASEDVKASSQLMQLYLRSLYEMGVKTFAEMATLRNYKFVESFEHEPLSGKLHTPLKRPAFLKPRALSAACQTSIPTSIEQQRMSAALYWDHLTSALADLDVDDEEAQFLQAKRKELDLQPGQVQMLHARAFADAINRFTDDQRLDDNEAEKLRRLFSCLDRLGWAPGKDVDIRMTRERKAPKDTRLAGKTFVFTGSLSRPREEFERLVLENGGKTSASVSKKTDYVVVGSDPGSKYDKAKSLGVPILSESQFEKLLSNK